MPDSPSLPDFESLKLILLAFSRERTLNDALALLVRRLTDYRPLLIRSCLWLTAEVARDLYPGKKPVQGDPEVLVLVADARKKGQRRRREWSHDAGSFQKVPFDEPLIGKVARSREVAHVMAPKNWDPRPEWADAEDIRSYAAAPLRSQGRLLGVFAVFSQGPEKFMSLPAAKRRELSSEIRLWMELFGDHVAAAVANALAFREIERLRHQLELENEYLREEVSDVHSAGTFIGESSALKKALEQVALVAPTDSTALITGESGTGKELVAREIHARSERHARPLIKVNCASIPANLFESEFFGHVRGAFTGALRDRMGRFELADGGTLFLDEVSEIPPALQAKLLRVVQEGEFEAVGDERTRKVDVRLIAATNRDLRREVDERRFREDLYYRLSVFPIETPPLRERKADIPLLATHFLHQASRRLGVKEIPLRKRHVRELQSYSWPGNIRELQNVIERAAISSRSGSLHFDLAETTEPPGPGVPTLRQEAPGPDEILSYPEIREWEKQNILAALEKTRWKVAGPGGAAELLELRPTTLASRLKAMGITKSWP